MTRGDLTSRPEERKGEERSRCCVGDRNTDARDVGREAKISTCQKWELNDEK